MRAKQQTMKLAKCRYCPSLLLLLHKMTAVQAYSRLSKVELSMYINLVNQFLTVTAPTANAKTSVTLVTVTATPACFRACAIFSSAER